MKKKDNPYVSIETCNLRYNNLNANLNKILEILRGDEKVNFGLIGDIRDIKRDRKWIYILLTVIGVPIIFLLIEYVLRG